MDNSNQLQFKGDPLFLRAAREMPKLPSLLELFATLPKGAFKRDRTPDVDKPTLQTYNEETDGSAWGGELEPSGYHCPCCGSKNTFNDVNDGDYYVGVDYYCFDCRCRWNMPNLTENCGFVVRTKLANEPEPIESMPANFDNQSKNTIVTKFIGYH